MTEIEVEYQIDHEELIAHVKKVIEQDRRWKIWMKKARLAQMEYHKVIQNIKIEQGEINAYREEAD
jgi:hypothetical protein